MNKVKKLIFLLLNVSFIVGCGANNSNSSGLSDEYEIIDSYVSNVYTSEGKIVTPFNTYIGLRTFSQKDNYEIFPLFNSEIQRLHKLFDRYNYYTNDDGSEMINLKKINDSYGSGDVLIVDKDLIDLLTFSIELSKLTEGYFNPTIGDLIDLWNYDVQIDENGNEYKYERFSPYCFEEEDVNKDDIEVSITKIIPSDELENYLIINKENNTIQFKKYGDISKVTLSLGAIAKGYAVEIAKELVSSFNVSAMIDGGSSSSYGIGKNPNPNRDYWVIGLASPYKSMGSVNAMATLRINGTYTLSVSGDYENSFYFIDENGNKVIRHHILNPFTGYPENYYRVVSLKSESRSDILDGLSTALFSIESTDKILEIIENIEDYYDITIAAFFEKEVDSENNKIDVYCTSSYKDLIYEYSSSYFNNEHLLEKK